MSGNIRSAQGAENFVDRTKRKSRRRSEKVSRMGGSESEATELERRIQNLKKGFGGDYGVKGSRRRYPSSKVRSSGCALLEQP